MRRVQRTCARASCGIAFEALESCGARYCSTFCSIRDQHGENEAAAFLASRIDDESGPSLWCAVHFAPIRDDRTVDFLTSGVALVEAFSADPDVRRRVLDDNGEVDLIAVDRIITDLSPICCYLGDDRMPALYERARVSGAINVA